MFATAVNIFCCSGVALEGGGGNCARAGVTRVSCSSTRAPAGPIVRYDILNTYPLLFLAFGMLVVLKRKPAVPGVTAATPSGRGWPAARRRNRRTCVVDPADWNRWASA